MTLTETLEKIGENRGEARGRAAEILALYKDSVLSAKKARERLLLLAERGAITQEVADKALKSLTSKAR